MPNYYQAIEICHILMDAEDGKQDSDILLEELIKRAADTWSGEAEHKRYIVYSTTGYWGAGDTLDEALKNLYRSGAKKKDEIKVVKFESDLPFAPSDREATDYEADAYMSRGGTLCYVRCVRIDV